MFTRFFFSSDKIDTVVIMSRHLEYKQTNNYILLVRYLARIRVCFLTHMFVCLFVSFVEY